jgi:ribosomal protein S18 acetylase RimI-like enzyme
MRVVEALTDADLAAAKSLIEEYATSLEIDLEFQGYREEIVRFPNDYAAPEGTVLLAYEGSEAMGVVALRRQEGSVCELKRLYVRPAFRGRGVGRALSEKAVRRAVEMGYSTMRLDTLPTMEAALALYRSLGFREIPPYRYNPVTGAHFLELDLSPE